MPSHETIEFQSYILAIAGLSVGIISLLTAVYFVENRNISLYRRDKYRKLYGKCKVFSIARESGAGRPAENKLIEGDLLIERRNFKLPRVIMSFDHRAFGRRYDGTLHLSGNMMMVALSDNSDEFTDFSTMVFSRPANGMIYITTGFLCGYDDRQNPYCGVCVLTNINLTREEIIDIIGDHHMVTYDNRRAKAEMYESRYLA